MYRVARPAPIRSAVIRECPIRPEITMKGNVLSRIEEIVVCAQCVSGSANFISIIDLGQRRFAVFAWNRDNFDSWWNDERPRLR